MQLSTMRFPDFETGKLYTAFDFTADFTIAQRKDQLMRLAEKDTGRIRRPW